MLDSGKFVTIWLLVAEDVKRKWEDWKSSRIYKAKWYLQSNSKVTVNYKVKT